MRLSRQHIIPFILLMAVILMGWLSLEYGKTQESQKLDLKTQIVSEQVGIRLQEFINTRLSRLDYFRAYVEGDTEITEAAFRSRALLIQHELSGFQAINWIDENGIIQWVTPLSANMPVLGIDLAEKADFDAVSAYNRAVLYRTDTASPLIDLVQGGKGFATYYPIVQDGEITGMINGVFRVEELIDQCLGRTVRDYNYQVLFGGISVFLRGEEANFESPDAVGRYNFNILGQAWELQIVPGSSEDKTSSIMSAITLAVAAIIGALIALYTYSRMRSQEQIRKAFALLEKSESKFKAIFDKSPAGLVRFNQNGMLTDWNQAAATLLQFEFPARRSRDLTQDEGLKKVLEHIHEALEGRSSEFNGYIHIGEQRREVESSYEPIVTGDHVHDGGIILLRDVTEVSQTKHGREVMYEIGELSKGEKDLPRLYESIQRSLNKIVDTRNFYIALFDEEKEEFTFSFFRDEFDTPPPPVVKDSKSLSAYIVRQRQPVIYSKKDIYDLNAQGEIDLKGTPAEQYLGAPLLVDNHPIGLMAIQSYSKEVTYDENDLNILRFVSGQIATTIQIHLEDAKLRRSEAKHRELSRQLSDSNNIKALLLDIITHDLKNPAGVISSVADMLVMDDGASDEVKLIKDSSDALLKVIADTTSLAKITLGEEVNREPLDISQILEAVIKEFKPSFEMNGKPLKTFIMPGLVVNANPVIAEVFRNYLSNALKYAPDNEEVTLELKAIEAGIQFVVSDKGKSIMGDDKEAIFKRSIQLENGVSRGSGLGLAIVKRIAEVHGAQVGVRPNSPQGNIFYMNLNK